MVCVNCGQNTAVTNSRLNKRTNAIWRRRQCLICKTTFTTKEEPKYSEIWLITGSLSHVEPFSRDKLYVSIYDCLLHRKDAVECSSSLTDTVIKNLIGYSSGGAIKTKDIRQIVQVLLNRFDKTASVKYETS
jgi:transcriptional regulator NrdR family protein